MAIDTTIGDDISVRTNDDTIDTLNSFLRGEISAVETYSQAAEKISEPSLRATIEDLRQSHELRVASLRSRVLQLGGKPAEGSGVWGGFAKAVEGGAKVFGTKTAIAALEEGEDHGLKLYRDNFDKLDAQNRTWVETEVYSQQRRSHDVMSSLKKSIH